MVRERALAHWDASAAEQRAPVALFVDLDVGFEVGKPDLDGGTGGLSLRWADFGGLMSEEAPLPRNKTFGRKEEAHLRPACFPAAN